MTLSAMVQQAPVTATEDLGRSSQAAVRTWTATTIRIDARMRVRTARGPSRHAMRRESVQVPSKLRRKTGYEGSSLILLKNRTVGSSQDVPRPQSRDHHADCSLQGSGNRMRNWLTQFGC